MGGCGEKEANFSCHYLPHVSAMMLTQRLFMWPVNGVRRERWKMRGEILISAWWMPVKPPPSRHSMPGTLTHVSFSLNTAFNLHNVLALHLCNLCLRNCARERRVNKRKRERDSEKGRQMEKEDSSVMVSYGWSSIFNETKVNVFTCSFTREAPQSCQS